MTAFQNELVDYTGEPLGTGFNDWLTKVNDLTEETLSLSIFDLPDMAYRDEYEDLTRPTAMLAKIMMDNGWA